jgi:hypothetical protein
LNIINTKINTYDIIRESAAAGSFAKYYLEGIEWKITEDDTQYCRRDRNKFGEDGTLNPNGDYYTYDFEKKAYNKYTESTYPEEGLIYEKMTMIVDGNLVCIPVLEYLQTKTLLNGAATHGGALSGTIYIDMEANVDQLTIYQRYKSIYPNVEITYGPKVTGTPMYTIGFANNSGMEATYEVPSNGTLTLAQLTSKDGPNGHPLFTPSNLKDIEHEYLFEGIWIDETDNQEYYQNDKYEFKDVDEQYLFTKFIPKKNMKLVPYRREIARSYQVIFHRIYHDDITFNT